ncbi:MAG: hypothetical protein RL490_2404, partial [Pseudomonadota bacterium]
SLKNLDTIKTTSVTTKTPVYGPVYDKKGKVIGQKIVSYTSVTTKSTLVTPKMQIYSTNGSSTLFSTPVVNFGYQAPVAAAYAPWVAGPQKAYFSLSAFSSVAPEKYVVGGKTNYSLAFGPGKLSFTRTVPVQLYTWNGKPNGSAKRNLLTVEFSGAVLLTQGSTTTLSLLASTPFQQLTFASDFLNFSNATDYDFALALNGANPALSIASIDPTLTNVTGARSFNTTKAGVSGGFSASAVPEPASWTMLIIGMGMIGGTLRQRRRSADRAILAIGHGY